MMLIKDKQIAIVGGGPGGLTLARLLQLNNVNAKVYERDLDKNARVQCAPLDLHENSGLAALRKANLLEQFKMNYMPRAHTTTITDNQAQAVFSNHDTQKEADFGHEHFRPEIAEACFENYGWIPCMPKTLSGTATSYPGKSRAKAGCCISKMEKAPMRI